MRRLPDNVRGALGLLTLCGALAAALILPAAGGAQTGRPTTRQRRAQNPAARPTPSPTPHVVPRLAPSATPPAVVIRTEQPPPPPRVRPTPTPEPPPDAEEDVVRVTSNLVVVPVSVTDAAGEAVTGLQLSDFRLEEEGRAQQLAAVGDAEQVPLDIALVFDVSSSVTKNFEFQKQSAAGFLRQVLKPIDRAALFTIAERPTLVQPLAGAAEATAGLSKLRAAEKSTGTAFYDTVTAAARYLGSNAPERNRRVILVLTDGEDNFSDGVRDATIAALNRVNKDEDKPDEERLMAIAANTTTPHRRALQNMAREVQRADAVFYSINPSGPGLRLNVISQRAQDNMQQVALTTGGNSFVPARLEDLDAVFRRIAAELRAQYLLQYLSNNEAAPAGKFLRIKVGAPARPGLTIRARQGYYKKG